MRVGAIWRYPVKSMAGERLSRGELTSGGLVGDRVVQVYDRRGRVVTARTFPRLLRLRATLGPDGEPLVDGLPWNSREVAQRVEVAVAPGARLERFDGPERFDILPLLVCTDGAVSIFGRDVSRLRPNILLEGVAGATERSWTGAPFKLPHAEVSLADLRGRCVMTTYDPDTAEPDPCVLRDIVRRFGGRLCLNAHVIRPGIVEEGDAVDLSWPVAPHQSHDIKNMRQVSRHSFGTEYRPDAWCKTTKTPEIRPIADRRLSEAGKNR